MASHLDGCLLLGAGDTDFSSLNGGPTSDAAFLDLLKAQTGPSLAGGGHCTHPTHAQLSKLTLQENDVAKVRGLGRLPVLSQLWHGDCYPRILH